MDQSLAIILSMCCRGHPLLSNFHKHISCALGGGVRPDVHFCWKINVETLSFLSVIKASFKAY